MKFTAGFTLVELIVSLAIVSLIMSVVSYNYSAFNDELAVSAGGQEIASVLRQAQTYGLSVKEAAAGSGQFNSAYGVYVDTGDNTHYYLFVDTNGNKKYDPGSGCGNAGSECVEKDTLRSGVVISSVCDGSTCSPSGATGLTVTYLRPNPDASINFVNAGGNIVGSSLTGKISLLSPQGKTLTVTIESTGQISVQ